MSVIKETADSNSGQLGWPQLQVFAWRLNVDRAVPLLRQSKNRKNSREMPEGGVVIDCGMFLAREVRQACATSWILGSFQKNEMTAINGESSATGVF